MLKNKIFFGLLAMLLVFGNSTFAQNPISYPSIIVNEIGFNPSNNKTFIEILVPNAGPYSPEYVDLTGWVIDNFSAGEENDNLMVRFTDYFDAVKPGTLIVLYDGDNPYDGVDEAAQFQVQGPSSIVQYIPLSSPHLEAILMSDFEDGKISKSGNKNWSNSLNLRGSNSGLFVYSPQRTIVNGIAWMSNNNPLGALTGVNNIGNALPQGPVALGAGTVCPETVNVQTGSAMIGSPGAPNNPSNANSVGNNPLPMNFSINCSSDILPGLPPQPQGRIDFLGGQAPFTITVTDSNGEEHWTGTSSATFVNVPGEAGEEYSVIVVDSRGCRETCSYTLSNSIETISICEGEQVRIGKDIAADCFKWEPEEGLISSSDTYPLAKPEETTTYTLSISDGCGRVTSEFEYTVNVTNVEDVEIISDPDPAVVFDNDVILSATGDWDKYHWREVSFPVVSFYEPTHTITAEDFNDNLVEDSRLYNLVVTDANECTNTATIEIFKDSDGDGIGDPQDCDPDSPINSSDSDGDGVCDDEDDDPYNACIPDATDTDGDGLCDNIDCDSENPYVGFGIPCNDGNACTSNDVFNADCECLGQVINDCEQCLEGSPCDDNNPCTQDDQIDLNCNCFGVSIDNCETCVPNVPCDDNNSCTTNDQFDQLCNCVGEPIINCHECIEDSPCDDKNECTINDKFDANCNCVGEDVRTISIEKVRLPGCEENQVTLTIIEEFDFYKWVYNGIEISTDQTITVYEPGIYNIFAFDEDCVVEKNVLIEDVIDVDQKIITSIPSGVCNEGDEVELKISDEFSGVTWKNEIGINIGMGNSIKVSETGKYEAYCRNSQGCEVRAMTTVSFRAGDVKISPQNPFICNISNGVDLTLRDVPTGNYQIKWSTGSQEESINVSYSGDYSVTITNDYGCETIDKVTVSNYDESLIESILLNNGFVKVPVEIVDIVLLQNDPAGSRNKSCTVNCEVNTVYSDTNYEIELEDGQRFKPKEYLEEFLYPSCTNKLDAAGIFVDQICDNPQVAIEKLVNYYENYQDGTISGFMFPDQDLGESFIYIQNTIVNPCLRKVNENPNLFIEVLNDILCAKKNEEFLLLNKSPLNTIFSGKVKLYDQVTYTNSKFRHVFTVENYRLGKVLDLKNPENCVLLPEYEKRCVKDFGGNLLGPTVEKTNFEGTYHQYSINYVDDCIPPLLITIEEENFVKFSALWNDPDGMAAKAVDEVRTNDDVGLIEKIPLCFIDDVDMCEILGGELKEHSPVERIKAQRGINHFLGTRKKEQAIKVIECLDNNNLLHFYTDRTFVTAYQKNSLFRETLNCYATSQISFETNRNTEEQFRLAEDPLFDHINSYSAQHPFGELRAIKTRGVVGEEEIEPFSTEVWNFNYFETYQIKVGPGYKHLNVDPDNEDRYVVVEVPGLYIAYAIENKKLTETERQEEATIAVIGLFFGLTEYNAAIQGARINYFRAGFGAAEMGLNAAALFLQSESFCEYLNVDFCEKFDAIKPYADLALLTGSFFSSQFELFSSARNSFRQIPDDELLLLESKIGSLSYDELVLFLNKIPDLSTAFAGKFSRIRQYALSRNLPDPIESIITNSVLKDKAHSLLKLEDEIKALDDLGVPAERGYKFMEDLLSSTTPANGLGRRAEELTSKEISSWRKLFDDGLSNGIRRDYISVKQKSIIDEYAGGIASSSRKRKGNFGEIGADLDLVAKDYESLMHRRINSIDAGGHNGLDGVYRKDGNYFIVEGKYSGSSGLNLATGTLPRQMSDDWIVSRDWSSVNLDQSIIDDLILTNNYQRILAKVKPDGTVTYRLIDKDGYAILGNAGVWNP